MKKMVYKVGFHRKPDDELFLSLGQVGAEDLAKVLSYTARKLLDREPQHESGDNYTSNGMVKLAGRYFYAEFNLTIHDLERTAIVFYFFEEVTKDEAMVLEVLMRNREGHFSSHSTLINSQTTYS